MMMYVADARVCPGRETKARLNRAIRVEPPLADVAIPTGFQLAYQDDFLALDIDRYAEKVSRIRASVENRRGGSVTKTESRGDVDSVCRSLLDVRNAADRVMRHRPKRCAFVKAHD